MMANTFFAKPNKNTHLVVKNINGTSVIKYLKINIRLVSANQNVTCQSSNCPLRR